MSTILLRTAITAAYCIAGLTTQTTYSMDNFFTETRSDIGSLIGVLSPTLGDLIDGEQSVITNNPYKHEIALAKHNTGISDGERAYLKNRLPIVKAALEKMLNRSLDEKQIPKIALIGSGGGYRAMLCTTGSLCGAQKIGLLDATTYITSLSGSTWAVAPWLSTGIPIKKFKNYIQDCAAQSFHDVSHEEKMLIARAIAVKKTYNQSRTLVDLYGDLLANRLLACLGDARQIVALSNQIEKIQNGAYPYPIYTAIDGRETVVQDQTWYEFTPHTIGDRTNNIHIPSWAYGRRFKRGESTNDAPEKPLSHLMGTWGSAFAASIKDILENIDDDKEHQNLLEKIAVPVEGQRIAPFWAKVPNYMYKMNDVKVNDETLLTTKNLKFVDAGLDANLPYPPVSGICPERAPDILIFLDASKGKNVGSQLLKSAQYAQKNNLPFPAINTANFGKKTISVFKDENNTAAPIVIYMPRISDKDLWKENKLKPEFAKYNLSAFDLDYETNYGFCDTKEFQYTPEHSTLVMNQTEFNMRVSKDAIIQEINWCIDRK